MRFITYALVLCLICVSICGHSAAQNPHATSTPLTSVVVGSCLRQDQPQPIWDTILTRQPDLMIFVGDNIYSDTADLIRRHGKKSTTRHHEAYATLAANPGFKRLRGAIPTIATWDDHDYGLNDAGGEYKDKDEAMALFLDFWQEPKDSPRRQQPGVYAAYQYGPQGQSVQVLLLDTRYSRSELATVEQEGTRLHVASSHRQQQVLSQTQWAWLNEQLQQPADLRLIVTSIQFLPDEHRFEKWANFPLERAKLAQLLIQRKVNGAILVSGDRHHAEISRAQDMPLGYPLYELTASGLNQGRATKTEANRYRVGSLYSQPHFGAIDIDWASRQVTLSIVDLKGQIVQSETMSIDSMAINQ